MNLITDKCMGMNKYYWWIIGCLWASVSLQAQEQAPVATGCPAGVYISLNRVLPYTAGYKVYRREDKGEWLPTGSYAPCINAAMLHRRMSAFAVVLPDYAPPGTALTDTLWGLYRSAQKEQIVSAVFPLLHLALGSGFLDTTAIKGVTYEYSFRFTDSIKSLETGAVLYQPATPQYAAMQLQQAVPDARTILAEWGTAQGNAAPFFDVYRRQAGGVADFKKLAATRSIRNGNRADSLVFMITDSSILPGITYDYFLVAKDYLGNNGNHSDTIRLQAGGRSNVPAVFNLNSRSDTNGIRLSWRVPPGAASLRNIIVLRSEDYDTGYHPLVLLPVTDSVYIDNAVKGGKNYFYQLITEGAFNYSIPTPRVSGMYTGRVVLLPPASMEARVVKGGIRINWRYDAKENIAGFKVYRSSSPRLEMQLVSDLVPAGKDTAVCSYTDSAATGNGTWYYAVTAVSRTSSQSPFSRVVSAGASRPDAVPAPDGIRYLWLNDSTVSLTWRDLHRDVQGMAAYRIYRAGSEQKVLTEGHIFRETTLNECTDTLTPGTTHWYAVQAVDIRGQGSTISQLVRIEAPVYKPLPPAAIRLYRQNKGILLTWNGMEDGSVLSYHIYKAEDNGKLILLTTIPAGGPALSYADAAVAKDRVYFYYITAVGRRGAESNRSEEISYRME